MKTFSIDELEVNVSEIVSILNNGGLVVAPTDTSYGLLVDATSHKSIEKLLKLKERPVGKAISVFVNGFPMMEQYVNTDLFSDSTKNLLPGSYTIVLPSLGKVSKLIEAEDATLGVRYVRNSLINRILDIFGRPLTATSANVSGKSPAYSIDAFLNQLSGERLKIIDAVIDAGPIPHNPPSTVIKLTGHAPKVIRANTQNYIFRKLYSSENVEKTREIAQDIYSILKESFGKVPVVILLDGELGSGKTTWTKQFAKEMGVEAVVSPTYNYECEYLLEGNTSGLKIFRHFDLYNISHQDDLASLHLERCLEKETVNIIEWPAQIDKAVLSSFVQSARLINLHFEYTGETSRDIIYCHN